MIQLPSILPSSCVWEDSFCMRLGGLCSPCASEKGQTLSHLYSGQIEDEVMKPWSDHCDFYRGQIGELGWLELHSPVAYWF